MANYEGLFAIVAQPEVGAAERNVDGEKVDGG